MKDILKKLFFKNNFLILVIFMFHHVEPIMAQRDGFITEFENPGYTSDIIEDPKGGFLFDDGSYHNRISNHGQLLWRKHIGNVSKFIVFPDSNFYYYFGIGSNPIYASFEMGKVDLEGNINWWIHEDDGSNTEGRGAIDALYDSVRRIFVVCGSHVYLNKNYRKYRHWIAGYDLQGHQLWENKITDTFRSRGFVQIFPNKKYYGYSLLSMEADNDRFEWFVVDSIGKLIKRAPIESNPDYFINNKIDTQYYDGYSKYLLLFRNENRALLQLNDSIIIATVEDPYKNRNLYYYNQDFGIIRRAKGLDVNFGMANNRFGGFAGWGAGNLVFRNNDGTTYGYSKLHEYTSNELLYFRNLKQAKDGGFYGVIQGNRWPGTDFLVNPKSITIVFKTDSIGLIHQTPNNEYFLPFAVQPNPAHDRVKISSAYYYDKIHLEFFNSAGKLVFDEIQYDSEEVDISAFAPGLYSVKATIVKSGQFKTIKLMVN